jgi:predicted alpha/beta hydrolase family esterase
MRAMKVNADLPRLLVIPGLNDSGPGHWQTWLQSRYKGAVRVTQDDWSRGELDAWSARIDATLAAQDPAIEWVAAAHSFGCLALARHLAVHPSSSIKGVLFVAPADPDKFGVADRLPSCSLGRPAALIGSETDPWMAGEKAREYARRWGASFRSLGDAGHINIESGHGPLPQAKVVVDALIQRAWRCRLRRQGRDVAGLPPATCTSFQASAVRAPNSYEAMSTSMT